MRVGIDARLYGVSSGTGIGRYTQELLRQFLEDPNTNIPHFAQASQGEQIPNDWTFTVFLRKETYGTFELPNDRWTKVLADFRPYTLGVQTRFPAIIRDAGVDLMHFTHFDHPLRCPVPFTVMIHDCILLRYPSVRASTLGPIRFWTKYAAYRMVLRHAVRASTAICTPSHAVAEDIRHLFGVPHEQIIVTPLGVDHGENEYPTLNIPHLTSNDSGVGCSVLGVRRPYVLYIGNVYPHKQIEWLVRAWDMVTAAHPDLTLVLVNRDDPFTARVRAAAGNRTQIVFTGALAEPDLRTLLVHATAYVSPSACEGFDLPTAEALALGVPVVASDIPTHREVLGDAAAFFPVGDDRALAHTIHRVLVDDAYRGILKARGDARVRAFTWASCAQRTLAVWRATEQCEHAARRRGRR